MRIRIFTIAVLFSLSGLAYTQKPDPAQTLRVRKQYRNTLAIFKEPQIYPPRNSNIEIYRIFIAPTFSHPVSIRMERTHVGYFIYAKILTGQGGYKWGQPKRQIARRITRRAWMGLLDLLNETSFWELPSRDEEPRPNEKGELTICLDGTAWYLEGVKGGTYQAVERYCPASKNFKAVGLYMLRLSKLGVKESEVL